MTRGFRGIWTSAVVLAGFVAGGWASDELSTPLYQHLLQQAGQKLDARAAQVAGLTGAASVEFHRDAVRTRIAQSMGGFPDRTPLNPRTVWTRDFDDYRIEGVLFESQPGLFVTAHLYLPAEGAPPYPVVLGPCGHSLEAKAGNTYQPAWINLARRGFAVLTYDPIGQGERLNFLAEDGKPLFWGTTEHTMLGAQALLLGHSLARDVVWDGVRAVDYIETRSDLDPSRIGCAGNSGGGTQTAFLMAVEPRIVCAAPSCYITTFARLFRSIGPQDAEQNLLGQVAAGLDHADFIAAALPAPVLLCAASDDYFDIRGVWETFRESKVFYGKAGLAHRVDLFEAPDGHGYSPPRRTATYHWMARWLQNRVDETPEPPTEIVPADQILVTESGQVLRSIPEARSLQSLYRDQLKTLESDRESLSPDQIRAEIRRVAVVRDVADQTFHEISRDIGDASTRVSYHTPIEPGWSLEYTLSSPTHSAVRTVILRVRDATAPPPERAVRVTDSTATADLFPRGLDNPNRLSGRGADRYFGAWRTAFLALHIDRPLLGQRAEDVLAVFDDLVRRFPDAEIRVEAERGSTAPALIAAVLDLRIKQLRLVEGIQSWASAFESSRHFDLVESVVPGILRVADVPDLLELLSDRRVETVSMRAAEGP